MCSANEDTSKEIRDNGFEFLKLDYEQGMLSVKQCHDQKLAYQKFYIAIVSAIIIISLYVQRIIAKESDVIESGSSQIIQTNDIDSVIGIAFIFAGIIGFIVVKNLAHIRINAVFYSNAVVDLRKLFIKALSLENYPDVEFANANDRRSADYITIILCSLLNLCFLDFGLMVLFGSLDKSQTIFNLIFMSLFYILFHFVGVERILSRGMRSKWEKKS